MSLSESDKAFAEEVLDLFRRRGKVLNYDYTTGWYVEPLGTDDLGEIRASLKLPAQSVRSQEHAIRVVTRNAVLTALREAISGQSERLMKEVWETCSGNETEEADAELRRIVDLIEASVAQGASRPSRAHYHEMLDRAMDRTAEGDVFIGKFVEMIVKEAWSS